MTGRRPRRGRRSARRRPRWVWPTVLVLVLSLGATLLGAGGTYALWNGTASTSATSVRSGTATITVGQMPAMYSSALGPGTSTAGTFTMQNTGSVPLDVRAQVTGTNVAYAGVPAATVLDELSLRLSVVTDAAACRPGLTGPSGRIATYDSGSGLSALPVGRSRLVCVEVALDADAPQSVSGAVTDFDLTVTGTQVIS